MPQLPGHSHYRRESLKPLALGVNDSANPTLLLDGQSPDAENVEFDRESVASSRGAIKFGNQPVPKPGIRTKVDRALSPLSYAAGKSVPSRGSLYFPYSEEIDRGGDFVDDGVAFPNTTWHARRGRSFDWSISFMLPAEEKLFGPRPGALSGKTLRPTMGVADQAKVDELDALGGYDEALEEICVIWQKGGDRLAALSYGLGIVNTGSKFEYLTGQAVSDRPSNYALVFFWLDAAQWGDKSPLAMRYKVGAGGANVGTTGSYSTLAYRAIIAKAWIEPGRTYHVSVGLGLDTGSPGTGTDPTAAWNQDGTFAITVRDDAGVTTRYATSGTDLFAWKGPADSFDYLTRYGVRFSGRDAMFAGRGMLFAPFQGAGFLPFGLDSAALESGGHRMLDVSEVVAPAAYGVTIACSHVSGDAFVTVSERALIEFSHPASSNPLDPSFGGGASEWTGLGDSGGTIYNADALRNYWGAIWNSGTNVTNGLRLLLGTYSESGGVGRFGVGLSSSTQAWSGLSFFPICFRWSQRPLVLSNFRPYSTARDYTNSRVAWSLGAELRLDDLSEPDITNLLACWPLDDAEGASLRELVAGREGFLIPFGLGRSKTTGGIFLSGEGEAAKIDFSENPIFVREMRALIKSGVGAFAIELELMLPEAYYALDNYNGIERVADYAPFIASWEVRSAAPGFATAPAPLMRFGHRARMPGGVGSEPFFFPQGFTLEVLDQTDQESSALEAVVHPWDDQFPLAPVNKWSRTAPWVGKVIRLQFGVESTGTSDLFSVYIAASPKSDLFPSSGDPPAAEFAYYETRLLSRAELERSLIVVGGAWQPESNGFSTLNCRMLLRQARVFLGAAPGNLPAASGGVLTARDGKLVGDRCLPEGVLDAGDLLLPLGPGAPTLNLIEGSTTISPGGGGRFFTGEPEDSVAALKETCLLVAGDGYEVRRAETLPVTQEEFYFVAGVAADGTSATLATRFGDASRSNAWARIFRLCAYSAFTDEIGEKGISLGKGTPFVPGTSTVDDAQLTPDLWINEAPISANWGLRIFSSLASLQDILPEWARGLATPRRNPITRIFPHHERLYATAQGTLFEADDRWREEGPTETLRRSLDFRASRSTSDLMLPLQGDALEFPSTSSAIITAATLAAQDIVFDAWLKPDGIGLYQTILWIGSIVSDPSANAGSALGTHHVHVWIRLARGFPEFVVGSTAPYDVSRSLVPERGLYVVRGQVAIPPLQWTHLRWVVEGKSAGASIQYLPCCYVNGRSVRVRANARQYGLPADEWLQVATIPAPTGANARVLLGVARDSYLAPEAGVGFSDGKAGAARLRPDRIEGFLHSFGGRLADVVIDAA